METGSQTQRRDGQVKVEAEAGVMLPQRGAPGPPEAARGKDEPSATGFGGSVAGLHPDLRPLASRSGREYLFVVLSYPVWGMAVTGNQSSVQGTGVRVARRRRRLRAQGMKLEMRGGHSGPSQPREGFGF